MAFGDFFLMISTSCLKKPTQERLRLFHSYAQARRRLIYQPIFKRQRSTLSMLFFGPKNGEHLQPPRGKDSGIVTQPTSKVLLSTDMLKTPIEYPGVDRNNQVAPGTNPVPVTLRYTDEPRVPEDGYIDVSVGGADWAKALGAVAKRKRSNPLKHNRRPQ